MIAVRRIGPEDAAHWRAIRLEALRSAPEAFSARLDDWKSRPLADFAAQILANPVFLAFEDGQAVGSATWTRDRGCPDRCWIESVFVRPAARGRGAAQALIAAAMADAKSAGMAEIWLEVGAANAAAQAAYRRAGFVRVEARRRPSPPCGRCEVGMWRAL